MLLVPGTDRSAIVATGKDRVSWLNGLVTCDLAKLAPGGAAYGLLVEKKGKIQADLYFVPQLPAREGGALALAVPQSLRDELVSTLDRYLIMEDVELSTPELAFSFAYGPRAAELMGEATFAGELDVLGTGGAILASSASDATFAARLRARVASMGGHVAEGDEWNAVRIEFGLPRFGVEVDSTLYPQEASLEKVAVSFDKGCYLGQEVVYMLEHRGHVKRKLVAVDLEGETPLAPGDALTTAAGEPAGEVKSSVLGPASGHAVAIAMVKWAHAKPGTELRAGDRAARVR